MLFLPTTSNLCGCCNLTEWSEIVIFLISVKMVFCHTLLITKAYFVATLAVLLNLFNVFLLNDYVG